MDTPLEFLYHFRDLLRERAALVEAALERGAALAFLPVTKLQRICPPIDEMLPP